RGGSKRIPGKNIRDFLGKPIIAYSIETALASNLFDEVMVSTDSKDIAQVAREYGAQVPFMRSNESADDHATTVDVLKEVLLQYKDYRRLFEYACCIYPTAPFVTDELLITAFTQLKEKKLDCVFPVTPFGYPIQRALRLDQNGLIGLMEPKNLDVRSQDLETFFHDTGQFYFFNIEVFFQKGQLWTDRSGCIVVDETKVQDIDNEVDWKLAELKYNL
ncbi:MAG: pseudaminic acid cytidylyltransferase, partial [Maribacter sp.]|nr:pseudaminic acid cytidylyltransferase [Maribacter sp.]